MIHVLSHRCQADSEQGGHSAYGVGAHVDDDVLLVSPFHRFLNLLQKDLGDPSTQRVHCLQKLQLERVVHGLEQIVLKGKLNDRRKKEPVIQVLIKTTNPSQ